ncbi:MAG: beta-aspartyl-peptidase [Bacillales bacterium]|jgi:beta-aspartyl-dipeptidase (metallo-type)|nr:beta-aspartyl-peptidase [Bacillales bacterium]
MLVKRLCVITLIKNVECYCPAYIGIKDILIANDSIYKIVEPNSWIPCSEFISILDCNGLIAMPGIIDGHVHITGGGGEDGFSSRITEIDVKDIFLAGVTTVVGLLGADSQTRSLKNLLAKAKSLEIEGLTTFIYSGSYAAPIITFTEDITSDMVLIDKVIGAGEIAIADHRSSYPDLKDILSIATKAHIGGLISGKAGLIHFHVGDGKSGLDLVNQLIANTDLPIDQFLPTHTNRNKNLFEQAIQFTKNGGNVDLTSGEQIGISVPDAVQKLLDEGVALHRVTISSDANGSSPNGEAGKIQTLADDIKQCLVEKKILPEIIFPLVTENVAKRIRQYPKKGTIKEGSDADILIMDKDFNLRNLFSNGKLVVSDGKVI